MQAEARTLERVRIGFLHQRDEVLLRVPAGCQARLGDQTLRLEGGLRVRPAAVRPGTVQPALKVLECADGNLLEAARSALDAAGLEPVLRDHAPGGQWGAARAWPTRLLSLPLGPPVPADAGAHMLRELAQPEDHAILARARLALGELAGRASQLGPPALWHLRVPVRCRWTVTPPAGGLALQVEGEAVERLTSAPLRLSLAPGDLADVADVRVGIGFHWDHTESLAYEDTLEIVLEPDGRLGVVNELPLERYLASVNSSEMTADSPPALLRAQTVAARSTLLATRGRHHAGEPFDICADDHCQCFRGSRTLRDTSLAAARDTAHQVLVHAGQICDARYSKSCGGIVEAYEHVWEDQAIPYLPSFRDTCRPDPDFRAPRTEADWREWIQTPEAVWCNTEEFSLPAGLAFSDGFYRWTVELGREEAASHIRRATGRAFGQLLELVPLERGASGRLKALRVVTDQGEFVLGKELAIRLALSPSCLYSALICFEWRGERLLIHGKGWGHGVGLCQLGATRMALEGRDWREILVHYYPGTRLVFIVSEEIL
ncbi:MAG: SpoIID/LytB domain-containing protein [Candidatus Delongbacteria bacterium]